MKVHIVLDAAARNPEGLRVMVGRLTAVGRLSVLNPGRLARHGILTADVPPEELGRVSALPGVLAAEPDEESSAGARAARIPSRRS